MNKHTPGPWHVADHDSAHCMIRGVPVPGVNNGETIAKVWLAESNFHDADARLIATAPEMLTVLKQLYDYLLSDPRYRIADQVRLRDLIDRAEGQ